MNVKTENYGFLYVAIQEQNPNQLTSRQTHTQWKRLSAGGDAASMKLTSIKLTMKLMSKLTLKLNDGANVDEANDGANVGEANERWS